MTKGQRSQRHIKNSSRWTIYIIGSVNETKLSCYTPPPTQHQRFFRNLPLFFFPQPSDNNMPPVLSPMPKYVLNIPLSFANETGVFKVVE